MKSAPVASLIMLCSVLFPAPAAPQTMAVQGETIEVSIVNLDVVVTDKKGHRVFGLPKEGFVVLEDGKPQPITNFSEMRQDEVVADAAGAPGSAPAPQPRRQSRVIVVFVDHLRLPHFKIDPIFAGLKKLLRETVQTGDTVMIASWNRRLTSRLLPTDDLNAVSQTLDTLAKESIGGGFYHVEDMGGGEPAATTQFMMDTGRPAGDDEASLFDQRPLDDITAYNIRQKINAIKAIVSSISAFDGKKVMILLTDRLGDYTATQSFDRTPFFTPAYTDGLVAAANAAGVAIYPFYPEGVGMTFQGDASGSGSFAMNGPRSRWGGGWIRPDDDPRVDNARRRPHIPNDYETLMNVMSSFNAIASQTGGIAAAGVIDIGKMLPSIRSDLGSYYSLAYKVPSNRHGQSHQIIVKTTDGAYKVRSRRQFIEKSDDTAIRDRVIANLIRAPEASSIAVTVSAGPLVRIKQHMFSVPITITVPRSSVTMMPADGTNRGSFTVYIAPGRTLGYGPGVWTQKVPFTAASESKDGSFTYEFDLVTDPATDRLSIGVMDDLSRDTGFARIDLSIRPD
jgi:VWFA-related protein